MGEKYTQEEIWYEDGGLVTLGNDDLRAGMSRVLSMVTSEVADHVLDNCFLVMPDVTEEGAYIPNMLIGHRDILVFSRGLLAAEEAEFDVVMLHEIAHSFLKHKPGHLISEEQYDKQERQAWMLVHDWVRQSVLALEAWEKMTRRIGKFFE